MNDSADTPEALPSGRSFDVQSDGSVHYWSRTMSIPVILTARQFAAVGHENTRALLSVLVSLIVLVLADGYRWVGEINNGTAIAILMAVLSIQCVVYRELSRKKTCNVA